MNPLITDYFAAESAIIARLKSQVGSLVPEKHYFTPFGIGEMLESSQPSPAIHVIYAGDVPAETAGRGEQTFVNQRWLVVLAIRCATAQLQDTLKIRQDAGKIVPSLLDALQGWAPVEWMRPLSRVGGPPAGYSSAFAYFPFLFQGRINT